MNCIDLDFTNKNAWQSALSMIRTLCGGSADLSFDGRDFGGWQLPTAEFRLDRPEELYLPQVQQQDGYTVETWPNGTVVLAEKAPEISGLKEPVWILHRCGAAAITYAAFKECIRVFRSLEIPPQLVWSSIPLAPMASDLQLTQQKMQACYAIGAVHTIWVRSEDALICAALKRLAPCGQVQVQNMATANTWLSGKRKDARLLDHLR